MVDVIWQSMFIVCPQRLKDHEACPLYGHWFAVWWYCLFTKIQGPRAVIHCMTRPLIRRVAVPLVFPQILKGHESVIRCMAVDGDRIVTGSSDKTVGVGAAGGFHQSLRSNRAIPPRRC